MSAVTPVRSTENPGYTGTGYVGAFGSVGQRITFNVHNVGTYTSYTLYLRERSIETGVTRRIYVNGVDYGLVALPQTSSTWTANAWALAGPVSINLHQGDNTIVIEYVGPPSRLANMVRIAESAHDCTCTCVTPAILASRHN